MSKRLLLINVEFTLAARVHFTARNLFDWPQCITAYLNKYTWRSSRADSVTSILQLKYHIVSEIRKNVENVNVLMDDCVSIHGS